MKLLQFFNLSKHLSVMLTSFGHLVTLSCILRVVIMKRVADCIANKKCFAITHRKMSSVRGIVKIYVFPTNHNSPYYADELQTQSCVHYMLTWCVLLRECITLRYEKSLSWMFMFLQTKNCVFMFPLINRNATFCFILFTSSRVKKVMKFDVLMLPTCSQSPRLFCL